MGCYVLPGAWNAVGLVETLPVVCSENSSGTELRGRRGGSLGSWVGTPAPFLFLPGPM